MNKYFTGIVLYGFHFEVPLFYSRHHRRLECTNDTASDSSVVEPKALQVTLCREVFFLALVATGNSQVNVAM